MWGARSLSRWSGLRRGMELGAAGAPAPRSQLTPAPSPPVPGESPGGGREWGAGRGRARAGGRRGPVSTFFALFVFFRFFVPAAGRPLPLPPPALLSRPVPLPAAPRGLCLREATARSSRGHAGCPSGSEGPGQLRSDALPGTGGCGGARAPSPARREGPER